jgi:Phospholipase_D-nuclease N-terminal/Short C-terminal domain
MEGDATMLVASFWETFFLLLIFLPLMMIWAFALVDIFRRDDIGGMSKALWVLCVFLLPFLGTLIYLIARPSGATEQERMMLDSVNRDYAASYSPPGTASQLQVVADLHDQGKLTDSEFEAEKARILAG